MSATAWPKIYCQANSLSFPPTQCRWLAARLCKSCNLSVCAAHWDTFAGICQVCARVLEGLPQ